MSGAGSAPGPWWVVVAAILAGAVVGHLLGRALATGDYRLDDEQTQDDGTARLVRARPVVASISLAILWGLLAWRLGGLSAGAGLPAYLLLAWAAVALAWVDVDVHRLPQGLTRFVLPALLLLLGIAALTTGDGAALLRALVAMAAAYAVYLALALIAAGGFGLGDVTLAALVALPLGYLGWWHVVVGLVVAHLAGGLVAVAGLLLRRFGAKTALPFGPFLLGGALVALLAPLQVLGA